MSLAKVVGDDAEGCGFGYPPFSSDITASEADLDMEMSIGALISRSKFVQNFISKLKEEKKKEEKALKREYELIKILVKNLEP